MQYSCLTAGLFVVYVQRYEKKMTFARDNPIFFVYASKKQPKDEWE